MILILTILCLTATIFVHEAIHWITAILLGYSPRVNWNFFIPSISYQNKQEHLHNLLIAGSAPGILFIIGLLLSGHEIVWFLVKIFCLANVFNLMPITNDGEVIFLSFYKIIKEKI